MARKAKIGDRVGVAEWAELASVGDVRRFLKWVIHSMKNQTLEPNHASIFAQIGGVMLKAVQSSELEKRIAAIESRQATPEQPDAPEANIVS